MTSRMTGAAVAAAALAILVAGADTGAAQTKEPCRGPFAKCAQQVGGWCESDGKGGQTMYFWGRTSYSAMYEQCAGKVYEQHGRPNPYKPATSQAQPPRR